MAYSLQLPNGTVVDGVPDNIPRFQALAMMRQQYPQAFGGGVPQKEWTSGPIFSNAPEAPATPKKGGLMGTLMGSTEKMLSDYTTAGQSLADGKEAGKSALERGEKLEQKYDVQNYDEEAVKSAYEKNGVIGAVKELASQVPGIVVGQVPNLLSMSLGARIGAAAGALLPFPGGMAVGAALGALATSGVQQYGSNIERQSSVQKEKGEEINPDLKAAATAGAAQGALDAVALRFAGGKTIARWLGFAEKEGKEAAEAALAKAAQAKLEATATRGAAKTAGLGVARGIAGEMPTEVAQQVLERWQAGLPLLDDDAIKEYRQTAVQTAMLGSVLGPAGSFADRSAARTTLDEQDRQKTLAAEAEKQKLEAERKASPEYQNSVEGLTAQRDALGNRLKELKSTIKNMADGSDEKNAAMAEHAAGVAQIKALNARIEEAKKSPEQKQAEYLVEGMQAPPATQTAPDEIYPGVPREEADAEALAADKAAAKQRGEDWVDPNAPELDPSEPNQAMVMAMTNPDAYGLWQKQAQRAREAGQFINMGTPGSYGQSVEDMAPVIGPNGKVVGYRPITPQERAAKPDYFELGQQIPEMQQQELALPEAQPLQGAPRASKAQRAAINLNDQPAASAAPVTPAGVREQNTWRIAVPGQDVSPRPREVIPPDAVQTEAPPAQGSLPLGDNVDALLRSTGFEGASNHLPRRLTSNVVASPTALVDRAAKGKKDAFANLLALLDDIRKNNSAARWKVNPSEGVAERNPHKAAARPEITAPIKPEQLWNAVKRERAKYVAYALREVVEKRDQMGLPPMSRPEYNALKEQIELLASELTLRSTNPRGEATPAPSQRFVWNKGEIRTVEHAKRVQQAILNIRNQIFDLTRTLSRERHKYADWVDINQEVQKLEAREEVLSDKLDRFLAGPNAQGHSVVRPWTGAKQDNSDLAMERPFGKYKAAREAIAEQVERVQDRGLRSERGPVSVRKGEFQLGQKYDYSTPPRELTEEQKIAEQTTAALEAEVTGRQKTMFGDRGTGALTPELFRNYIKLFQGQWRKKKAALREAIDSVKKAVAANAKESTNLRVLRSRLNEARTTLDRLAKLLENDKYSHEVRSRIDELVNTHALWAKAADEAYADLKIEQRIPAFFTRPDSNRQKIEEATVRERQARINARKAELALKPWQELSDEIAELDAAHEEAQTAFTDALRNLETAQTEQHVAGFHVARTLGMLRDGFKNDLKETAAAVEKSAAEVKDSLERFGQPTSPEARAERPHFKGVTTYAKVGVNDKGEKVKLRGKKALANPDIMRMAREGYTEPKRRTQNEQARRDEQVQRNAFEEQTGQQGLFDESAEKAREARKLERETQPEFEDTPLSVDEKPLSGWERDNVSKPLSKDALRAINELDLPDTMLREVPVNPKRRGFIARAVALVAAVGLDPRTAFGITPNTDLATRIRKNDLLGALGWIEQQSANADMRKLAGQLRVLLAPVASKIDFSTVKAKSTTDGVQFAKPVPARLGGAAGIVRASTNGERIELWLRDDNNPDYSGVNEMTLLHEALHAALMARYYTLGVRGSENNVRLLPAQQGTEAAVQFGKVWGEFREVALKEAKQPNAPVWLQAMVANPDEFFTESLTNPEAQAWLKARMYQGKTLWDRFKEFAKRLLGFIPTKPTPTWLDAALMASNDVLAAAQKDSPDMAVTKAVAAQTGGKRASADITESLARAVDPNVTSGVDKLFPKRGSKWDAGKKAFFGGVLRAKYVDRWDPTVRAASRMDDSLKGSQMVYYARMADRSNQLTAEALTHGPIDLVEKPRNDGRKEYVYESGKGVNMRDILKLLKGENFRQWAAWMALKRAQELGKGLDALLGYKAPLLSDQEVQAILAHGDKNPAYTAARDAYMKFNAGLINLLVKTGAISQKAANEMLSRTYIPFYRVDKNGDVMLMSEHPTKIGNVRDQADLARLVGSDRPLDDPFMNIATNARILMKLAVQNQAAKNIAFTLQGEGIAKIVNANARGRQVQDTNAIHFKHEGEDKTALVDTGAKSKYEDISPELLVKGMEGIATTLPDALRLLQMPAKFLRDAITLMPTYMMRQLLRDPAHAWLSTGIDFSKASGALKRSLALAQHRDKTGELLRERGLVGGQVIQGNDEDMGRIMAQLHAGEGVVSKAMMMAHDLATASDAATRAALYDDYIAKGLSDMEATLATMDSVNFATRGYSPSVHALNMVIPFFNAQIQGLDSVVRALRGQMPFNEKMQARKKLVQRAMMVAAGTVMYYALVEDEDWYKNTPENVKLGNWLFKMPGVDEPIRIPIPFEFGFMFKAVPETIMLQTKDDKEAKAALRALANQLANQLPGGSSFFLPAAMKPAVESAANHSFFTGKPIVPGALENEDAPDQWTLNTTETAKALGNMTGTSPMQLENLIRGYTGPAGYAVLQLIDAIVQPTASPPPEKPLSRTALIGPMFQQIDGPAVINRAYDAVKKIEAISSRYSRATEQGRFDDAEATLKSEDANLIGYKRYAGQFTQQMGKLTKLERQIHFSAMDPAEKAAQIGQIRQLKIQLSRQFEQSVP